MERVGHLRETPTVDKITREKIRERFIDVLFDAHSLVRSLLWDEISDHFKNAGWSVDDIYASGGERVEGEVYDVELEAYDFELDQDNVVENENEPGCWIVSLPVSVNLTVSIALNFFKWDSVDREEIKMSGQSIAVQSTKEVEILLSSFDMTLDNPIEDWNISIFIPNSDYEVGVGEVSHDFGGD